MKQAYSKRITALEAACGVQSSVSAIYLADTDEVVVLSMASAAEHERIPRAVFVVRYPQGAIVGSLGAAWMWEVL